MARLLFVVFLITGLITPAYAISYPPDQSSHKWKLITGTTKDGRKVTQIQLRAQTPLIDQTGAQIPIIFAIECRGSETTAALALLNTAITAKTSMTRLTLQTDQDKPARHRFHRAANKKALLIRSNKSAIALIRTLTQKKTLMVTAPFSIPKVTAAIFNLDGLSEAVKPVSAACNW